MERRRLGNSALELGWLGLAPAGHLAHDELAAAIDALCDAGGDLVACRGDDHKLLTNLSTHAVRPGLRLALQSRGTTRGDLLRELDASLETLAVDGIDLWVLQGWAEPWTEIATAAQVAVSSGRVHYVAVAMPEAWQDAIVSMAIAHGPPGANVVALGAPYSLVDRTAEKQVLPAAASLGAGFIAGAPLGHGVLTGKYRHGTPPDSRGATERDGARIRRMLDGPRRQVIDGAVAAAEGLAAPPSSIALAWVRDSPGVSSVIVSARTIHQWRGLLRSDDLQLPGEIRSALDDVSAVC